jgi:amino acid adenylation domain-containing protein
VALKLERFSRNEGVTLFMTLLAAFQILLGRYCGSDDVAVGVPVAGRNQKQFEGLIGFFVNTVVLRSRIDRDLSFRDFLRSVRQTCIDAYSNQDLPFEHLVEALQPQRDLSRPPLFQVMFALQNIPPAELKISGVRAEPVPLLVPSAQFDLSVVLQNSGSIHADVDYNQDLLDQTTVARVMQTYQSLLAEVADRPDARLVELGRMSGAERQQIIVEWNETEEPREDTECVAVHEAFEEQVVGNPRSVAVANGEQELTYLELDTQANRLAHQLRRRGVGPEVRVGLLVDRSIEMVIGLLGILKAGGVYVPLEPSWPRERVQLMAEDAAIRVLVSRNTRTADVATRHWPTLLIGEEDPETVEAKAAITGEQLAYVLYTSGSTGRPKGVMVSHRALSNTIYWRRATFRLGENDRILQNIPFSFDPSLWQIFGALSSGASLILAEPQRHQDISYLMALMETKRITIADFAPSLLHELIEAGHLGRCKWLRHVFVGGEALSWSLREQFIEQVPHAELHHMYGPTETAIDATSWTASTKESKRSRVPIGRPIANKALYVLDGDLHPVPLGTLGELHIGGEGVARGYLGKSSLTAEKFLPDPFWEGHGGRMYATGDLGRYLHDGSIEFIGRRDRQIKIRGQRAELQEIEALLLAHPQVQNALVLVHGSAGDERLVAYVAKPTFADDNLKTDTLRDYLREKLPLFMVPAAVVVLESFPLLPSGKVDLGALPTPAWIMQPQASYVAPRSYLEEMMARIWAEVLKVPRVGVHDNFFALGGHSLLATRVLFRVQERLGIDIAVRTLFEFPTIADLATHLRATGPTSRHHTAVPPIMQRAPSDASGENAPLSFAQERLWVLSRMSPGESIYTMPVLWAVNGNLDIGALSNSLQEIVNRHELLRTTFPMVGGRPAQVVKATADVTVPVVDLGALPEQQQRIVLDEMVNKIIREPFDLDDGPLFHARLFRATEQTHFLLLNFHHLIADGWSIGILFRELAALYCGFRKNKPATLPVPPIQYADFALWQLDWLKGDVLERQIAFWRQELAGLPTLELKTTWPRPARQSFHGGSHELFVGADVLKRLNTLARQESATLFMVLLSVFLILLQGYSGQSDIPVGTPIATRYRSELEDLIGLFLNTLVLRGDVRGNPTFIEVLRRTKETTLRAFAHQDLPFERLVQELQVQRDVSRTPLFQVMFVLNNMSVDRLTLEELDLVPQKIDTGVTAFDLILSFTEEKEGLNGIINYNRDLFDQAIVAQMAQDYQGLLEQVMETPTSTVAELRIMSKSELEREPQSLATREPKNPLSRELVSPRSELERAIAEIWREVLNLPSVTVHENFFDLGGTSLLLIRVHLRLQKTLGREFSVVDLFAHPTIAELAGHLAPPESDRNSRAQDSAEQKSAEERVWKQIATLAKYHRETEKTE